MIKVVKIYEADEQGVKILLIVCSPDDDISERVKYANNYSGINLVLLFFAPFLGYAQLSP